MVIYPKPAKRATSLADDVRIMIQRDEDKNLVKATISYRGNEYDVNEDDSVGALIGPKNVTGNTTDAMHHHGQEKVMTAIATITEYFETLIHPDYVPYEEPTEEPTEE